MFEITPSYKKGKKYQVQLPGKIVHFGDSNYEDYTVHHDDKRKQSYQQRHQHDKINDPFHAGFWSYWVLWNKKSLEVSKKEAVAKAKHEISNKKLY